MKILIKLKKKTVEPPTDYYSDTNTIKQFKNYFSINLDLKNYTNHYLLFP